MWFKQHTHRKKHRILTFMLATLLAVTMAIPMINSNTLEVHAYEENVGGQTGNNDDLENNTDGQGVSWKRTGWLVYVAGVDGTLKSGVAFISGTNKMFESRHDKTYLYSRIGHQAPSRYVTGAPWGPAMTNGGGKVRDKLANYVQTNGDLVIQNLLGDDILAMTEVAPDQYYLIFETVSWHGRPGNGDIDTVATHWGYVQMWADGKAYGSGKGYYPYNKIAQSVYVEKEWPGLIDNGIAPPTTFLSASSNDCLPLNTMLSAGYGMGAFRLDLIDGGIQSTCDEPEQPEPHKPPEESTGTFKIVKSYRIRNLDTGARTDKGTYVKPDSDPNVIIEDESEYKLVEWKTSTTYKPDILSTEWHKQVPGVNKQGGKNPATIRMEIPETTLYVLLEKPEQGPPSETGTADFIMSQSTITRKIKLSYPDNNGITLLKDVTFRWERPAHKYTCSHTCNYSCSSGCKKHSDGTKYCGGHSHSVSCNWGEFKDNHTDLALKNANKSNYPDILATKGGWENMTTTALNAHTVWWHKEHNSGHLKGDDYWTHSGVDYSCVLLRGKDKLTVAQWKNIDLNTANANSDLAGVSSSGFSIGDSASGSRRKAVYFDSFVFKAADDSPDLVTTYGTTSTKSCHSNSFNCGNNSRTFGLVTNLSITAGVRVETYAGDSLGGIDDTSCNSIPTEHGVFSGLPALSGLSEVRGIEVQSGGKVLFRPYIQMNYDLPTETHEKYGSATTGHRTAYVIGNEKRTMTPNDYAEVSWRKRDDDKPNLTLSSLQWSTHASAKDFIENKLGVGNLNKFTVLPGGATLDLTIKDTDRQRVQVTTYQCVLEGSGKTQIDKAGGSDGGLTPSAAEVSHDEYVTSVVDALEQLNVEQYVVNNIESVNGGNIESSSKQVWNMGGEEIQPGYDLSPAGHRGQAASSETKYYLRDDGTLPDGPAGEGDLDVEVRGKTSKKYTFFTNTFGEIRYTVDDVNPNTGGDERKGNLANDTIANQINKRTHIVDKLQAAVEQGTGNDPSGRSKTGTAWYNEAFDGITVYVQTTELSVGYIDPPQRTTVLDPRLTQTQQNQSDMFNKDKYNMSQYKTKYYSYLYEGDNDRVGEFKGIGVYMKDMNMMFFSRQFFIPNATVDDLH